MDCFIWTEIVNCGKMSTVSLESFLRFHPGRSVHVLGTPSDFEQLGSLTKSPRIIVVDVSSDEMAMDGFRFGHRGTAVLFTNALLQRYATFDRAIHFDSDTVFKADAVGLVGQALLTSDLVGSRRLDLAY